MRKMTLIPAFALAAGLLLADSAQAQPPLRPGFPPPSPPGLRPPPPIGLRPPGIGIDISIGRPMPLYPVHRPPVIVVDPICEHYRVMYRDCPHDPWRTYRVYESHRLAHRVANDLRDMGYEARVLHD